MAGVEMLTASFVHVAVPLCSYVRRVFVPVEALAVPHSGPAGRGRCVAGEARLVCSNTPSCKAKNFSLSNRAKKFDA